MHPSLSRKLASVVPEGLKHLVRRSLYTSLPYGLSQIVERSLRSENVQLLENRARVCRRHGCIFVHIPRTAGTSITKALFDGPKPGGHTPATDYRMVFDQQEFDALYKFSIVRNPWDRLVSSFFFLRNGGMREDDRIWAEEHLSSYETFDGFVRGWLRTERLNSYVHFVPQSHYLLNLEGQLTVDYVGRFEDLEVAFETIRCTLGIEATLPHRNRAPRRRKYRKYYSDDTAELVREVYADDIELLEYEF